MDEFSENNGWIKIHRSMLKWEWHDQPEMMTLYIHLLLLANHAPSKWRGVTIERGQVLTGRKALSRTTGLHESMVTRCINKLKSTNEVNIKSNNQFTIITICNYNTYQNKNLTSEQQTEQQIEQRANNERTTSEQRANTNKKNKKNKNEENEKNSLESSSATTNKTDGIKPPQTEPTLDIEDLETPEMTEPKNLKIRYVEDSNDDGNIRTKFSDEDKPKKTRKKKGLGEFSVETTEEHFKIFEKALMAYRGTKNAINFEFLNFQQHKDWDSQIEKLLPAIEQEIKYKDNLQSAGKFVPQWANFKKWINERRWEQTLGVVVEQNPQTYEINKNQKLKISDGDNPQINPPTESEIQEFMDSNDIQLDVSFFLNYFSTSNWFDKNGNPVLNWKLKALQWAKYETGKPEESLPENGVTHEEYLESEERMKARREQNKKDLERLKYLETLPKLTIPEIQEKLGIKMKIKHNEQIYY